MSDRSRFDEAMMVTGPDGMPVLSRGQHLDPHDGACVMETVSVLAGEPWSDRPRCTHPALSELARMVNDSCPAAAYPGLARLAPELIGTAAKDARITPALVLICLGALRTHRLAHRPAARAHERWARRRLARASRTGRISRTWIAATESMYRTGPARHAMAGAVYTLGLPGRGSATERLLSLLGEAIAVCRPDAAVPERGGSVVFGSAFSPARHR